MSMVYDREGMPHWRAVWHVEGKPPLAEQVACYHRAADAADRLARVLWAAQGEYWERHDNKDEGGLLVSDGVVQTPVSWEDAARIARAASEEMERWFAFRLKEHDPDDQIDSGPCRTVLGVNYTIEGCDGTECKPLPALTDVYWAADGHRYEARLKCHPRTGEPIYDYDGRPQYSTWDAVHLSEQCCTGDPESEADWVGVQQWESGDDW